MSDSTMTELERLLTKAQIEVRQAAGARALARQAALEEADDAIVDALKIVRAAAQTERNVHA